jgi:hypothetical protein
LKFCLFDLGSSLGMTQHSNDGFGLKSMIYSNAYSGPVKVIFLCLLSLGGLMPVMAQAANFDGLVVSPSQSTATASGFTAGFYAISNIANRDHQGNVCVGFADINPDHILTLEQDVTALTVEVNSGGNDTTLLIQGPGDSMVRCGEDIDRSNPDARIADDNWAAGTYRIWVGAHHQGQRYNYSIHVTR